MNTINYEWRSEPNYAEYKDFGTFYDYKIIRNKDNGVLLGYVQLAHNHSLYGCYDLDDYRKIKVHGGVSFSGYIFKGFYVGFDCGHAGDLQPMVVEIGLIPPGDTYKNIQFVQKECLKLALQLKELE